MCTCVISPQLFNMMHMQLAACLMMEQCHQYAADLYNIILTKDKANAYATNDISTVLAEKGEFFKVKEVFN